MKSVNDMFWPQPIMDVTMAWHSGYLAGKQAKNIHKALEAENPFKPFSPTSRMFEDGRLTWMLENGLRYKERRINPKWLEVLV